MKTTKDSPGATTQVSLSMAFHCALMRRTLRRNFSSANSTDHLSPILPSFRLESPAFHAALDRLLPIRAEEAKVKQVLATAVASRALAELGRMASRETIYLQRQ
jgi:hypothetical protein